MEYGSLFAWFNWWWFSTCRVMSECSSLCISVLSMCYTTIFPLYVARHFDWSFGMVERPVKLHAIDILKFLKLLIAFIGFKILVCHGQSCNDIGKWICLLWNFMTVLLKVSFFISIYFDTKMAININLTYNIYASQCGFILSCVRTWFWILKFEWK